MRGSSPSCDPLRGAAGSRRRHHRRSATVASLGRTGSPTATATRQPGGVRPRDSRRVPPWVSGGAGVRRRARHGSCCSPQWVVVGVRAGRQRDARRDASDRGAVSQPSPWEPVRSAGSSQPGRRDAWDGRPGGFFAFPFFLVLLLSPSLSPPEVAPSSRPSRPSVPRPFRTGQDRDGGSEHSPSQTSRASSSSSCWPCSCCSVVGRPRGPVSGRPRSAVRWGLPVFLWSPPRPDAGVRGPSPRVGRTEPDATRRSRRVRFA